MPQPEKEKITVRTIAEAKRQGRKIAVVTAYDHPTARLADDAGLDIILVGDSLGMVVQGNKNTLSVTLEETLYHTKMVARAEPRALLVSDMPYASFHISREQTVANAIRLVKEGGAEAVKLEGGRQRLDMVRAIVAAEIPVMGHVGLTPQSIHAFGGFKVQGKLQEAARLIVQDALLLQEAGVFSIVLESIPEELGAFISETLTIPTIGIGAGRRCDGQVLVFHDLIGFTDAYMPRFVRKYADVRSVVDQALRRFADDIRRGDFPGDAESYHGTLDVHNLLP